MEAFLGIDGVLETRFLTHVISSRIPDAATFPGQIQGPLTPSRRGTT
jgi:hypothetical protein